MVGEEGGLGVGYLWVGWLGYDGVEGWRWDESDTLDVAVKVTYMHGGRGSFIRDGTLNEGLGYRCFTSMSRDLSVESRGVWSYPHLS